MLQDSIKWSPTITVDKWDPEQVAYVHGRVGSTSAEALRSLATPETVTVEGNLLTTVGLTRISNLIIGSGAQALTSTAVRIGIGDSTGTAAVGDTDLLAAAGSTHRWFQVLDATYPTVTAGTITFQATLQSGDGNFTWNEYGIEVGTPTVTSGSTISGTLINHKTSAGLGTKVAGYVWSLRPWITLS